MAEAIEITQPEKIQSLDVLDLTNRIDRYLQEMHGSVSATRNESTNADITRWEGLQDDLKRKFEIFKSQPELDLPKYHPEARPLPSPPELFVVQNPDVMNMTNLFIAVRTEMVRGEASERTSGFSEAQAKRIDAVLERIDKTLADIKACPECDSPNSNDEKPGAKK